MSKHVEKEQPQAKPNPDDYMEALFVLLTEGNDYGDFQRARKRCPDNSVLRYYDEQRRIEKYGDKA